MAVLDRLGADGRAVRVADVTNQPTLAWVSIVLAVGIVLLSRLPQLLVWL